MDPEKINKADHDFIEKFHQLKVKLADRQQESARRPQKKVFRLTVPLIITLLLIVGVGLTIIHETLDVFSTAPLEQVDQTPQPEAAGPLFVTPSRDNEKSVKHVLAVDRLSKAHKKKSPDEQPLASKKNTKDKIVNRQNHLTANKTLPPDTEKKNIERISTIVCNGVHDRQYLDANNVFYPTNDHCRAYVWMEVWSVEQPFVIKHIYYRNGQKYCEVPLNIKHARMRTWSYVTLDKTGRAGSWKVEIVYNDCVLKTVRFQVKDV